MWFWYFSSLIYFVLAFVCILKWLFFFFFWLFVAGSVARESKKDYVDFTKFLLILLFSLSLSVFLIPLIFLLNSLYGYVVYFDTFIVASSDHSFNSNLIWKQFLQHHKQCIQMCLRADSCEQTQTTTTKNYNRNSCDSAKWQLSNGIIVPFPLFLIS